MTSRKLIPVLLIACACGDLTKVEAPDLVQRGGLGNANGAVTFFNGAVSSFYSVFGTSASYSASGPFLTNTGLLADELIATSTFSGLNELDRHLLPETSGSQGTYFFLQVARSNQVQALAVLKQALPSQRWRIGQLYAFLGYVETFLAEVMCSGVPLSSVNSDFTPQYGAPLTTAQLLEQAVKSFDSALVYSTDSVRILSLARVGKARALLNLDKPAEAGAAVAGVLTSFSFITEHSATVQPNNAAMFILGGRYTIADVKGTTGINYRTASDQRINAVLVGNGTDGTPVYRPSRLTSAASPNILANGIEARLVEAEAALRAGDATTWLAKLNDLRANATSPAMTPLTDPVNAAARVDLQFRERAFWLFLTGHRFGDMRRLVRHYGRAANTVFPTGPYKFGGNFGTDIQLPIDVAEVSNNPLMGGKACLDRNP